VRPTLGLSLSPTCRAIFSELDCGRAWMLEWRPWAM
jgi:hypothetical protein